MYLLSLDFFLSSASRGQQQHFIPVSCSSIFCLMNDLLLTAPVAAPGLRPLVLWLAVVSGLIQIKFPNIMQKQPEQRLSAN